MENLTPKQKRILDFVNTSITKKRVSPSLEEIAKRFKLNSVATVHQHVEALKTKGFLERQKNQKRGIEINSIEKLIKIPILGTIAAGQPIEAIEEKETIAVSQSKIPSSSEVYALRVVGSSMVDENINEGDVILVRQQSIAENGQKVVALIDNHEATLKKFYRERGRIRLQPANKNMEPLIFRNGRDISIQGIVLDVIRESGADIPEIITGKAEQDLVVPKPYYEKPRFKLYQANCLDVLAKLPENSVDMIFADPPYNLSNGGITVHAGRMVSVNKGEWDKSKGFKDDYDFHYKWLEACKRILKPHGTLWVSGTYHSIYQCGYALQSH